MKLARFLSILCAITLAASALSGCSAQTAAETATQTAAPTAETAGLGETEATYVQVQSIDGGTITAIVGTLAQNDANAPQNGGQQGTAPEQSSGDGSGQQPQGTPSQDGSGQQPQGTPSLDSSGQQPQGTPSQDGSGQQDGSDGERQQGGAFGGQGFTAGDETITFTVGDATVITLADGSAGTIEDIAADDILAITLGSDNVAETIVVQQTSGAPADMSAGS